MEAVTLNVKDIGAKVAMAVKSAAISLAHGMLTKHMRLDDQSRATAAGPVAKIEHAARLAAILPVQYGCVAARTVQSQPTAFPSGSLRYGIGLGTAPGVAANVVNYGVVPVTTAEDVAAGKRSKKHTPYIPVDCPLCKVALVGKDKRKHMSGEACSGFLLLVTKFVLKKKGRVPETRAQCGWIALQDPDWIKRVVAALKRENNGRSNITCGETGVVETNVSGGGGVALSSERVRPRTESLVSDRGDTRSRKSNGGDDVA